MKTFILVYRDKWKKIGTLCLETSCFWSAMEAVQAKANKDWTILSLTMVEDGAKLPQ